MRFTVRSLGGKLIGVAALILLLCMLLFTVTSWGILKYYSEYEARIDAHAHLNRIQLAYTRYTSAIVQELDKVANSTSLASVVSQPDARARLPGLLETIQIRYHLEVSALDIISRDHHILAQQGNIDTTSESTSPDGMRMADRALQGEEVSSLQRLMPATIGTPSANDQWVLNVAVPLRSSQGVAVGVLSVSQLIDGYFAQELTQRSEVSIVLCMSEYMLGAAGVSMKDLAVDQSAPQNALCTPGTQTVIHGSQYYLAVTGLAHADHQMSHTPSLGIVTVEPLYSVNSHSQHLVLLVVGMGVAILGFGVIIYAFIARMFFIRPLHRLQARAQALVGDNGGTPVSSSDELSTLSRSFNLLSQSLESENQAMTEQMSNLLIMSDALISTLNLEHLLGEIVARLGHIMQVKHVSLLLYGREMLAPWAVAQWSDPAESSHTPPNIPSLRSLQQQGAVTVHADPDGDITLAVTTKMAAIPSSHINSASGKRDAIRPPSAVPYGLRRPRIPRPALRDLDMILACMVIQRHKIAYGEDITTIYQERGELWAQMALEAGYRSVIVVPLLLQDRAIGAFALYADKPYQVSSRDTFLLSTAANQASMAIQNAALFAEVKEQNAALERADQLKSQFLANVTHELRTPLHSIISYGALILEGFLDGELTKEQEEHIQFIVRRAEDLSHLVDDMLDLSKIEADRIEVKAEPLELAPCLMEVVSQLKPMANNKELYLALEVEEGLPMAYADSHRIRQIVINLISNALKFTETGGVTIRCMLMKKGNMLRISVQDTGIGISPAALSYIFEAFRQADGSTTRQFGGTGLGLTIAKKLIELQGGEVMVESIVGRGSTFSFTLPVISSSTLRT